MYHNSDNNSHSFRARQLVQDLYHQQSVGVKFRAPGLSGSGFGASGFGLRVEVAGYR